VDKYSEVPINEKIKNELRTKKIPVSDTLSLSETLSTEVKRGKHEPK
jgi:hypothetical protein